MTVLASAIIASARTTLLDPSSVAWSDNELLDYTSKAQRAICNAKPDAYVITAFVDLVSGPTQTLPDDGLQLFDIFRNSDGSAINQVGREILNATNRNWMGSPTKRNVDEYVTDLRSPLVFLVNPPNNGTGSIEIMYGAVPPDLTQQSGDPPIVVKDTYETAIYYYVLALAYAKNTKRQDLAKSQSFMGMFNQSVGIRSSAQASVSPKLDATERPG